MTKVSRSPDRYTFQKDNYIKRCESEGKAPNQAYLEMYENFKQQDMDWEENHTAHENNMEWDLRTSQHLCAKARSSDTYAQNLYAAMCNTEWQKHEVLPILKDQTWSCTWRYAGGIVADMRGQGDYIDWYCSGIRDISLEQENKELDQKNFVAEGHVTEEIADDLYSIGWVQYGENDND
jgi:hypothetical protein